VVVFRACCNFRGLEGLELELAQSFRDGRWSPRGGVVRTSTSCRELAPSFVSAFALPLTERIAAFAVGPASESVLSSSSEAMAITGALQLGVLKDGGGF
jgi:hypothetical protein